MYQIKLSTEKKYSFWIQYLYGELKDRVEDMGGIAVQHMLGDRSYACFAIEHACYAGLKRSIVDAIVNLFAEVQKRYYFLNALNIRFCDSLSRDMLINALTAFNSPAERDYIRKCLRLTDDFHLDGFYNFRLTDLTYEWLDSAELIAENNELVRNEESFNVIMKFLLSGIEAQIKVVLIAKNGKDYVITDHSDSSYMRFLNSEQMLLKLAELAPEKVVVANNVTDCQIRKKIDGIFCVHEENLKKS